MLDFTTDGWIFQGIFSTFAHFKKLWFNLVFFFLSFAEISICFANKAQPPSQNMQTSTVTSKSTPAQVWPIVGAVLVILVLILFILLILLLILKR